MRCLLARNRQALFTCQGVRAHANRRCGHTSRQVELSLTLALFAAVYLFVFGAGVLYMIRLMGQGPSSSQGHAPVSGGPGVKNSTAMSSYSTSRGIPRLRRAISHWYRDRVDIDPDTEAIATIGSKEGVAHLMLATLGSFSR